MAPRFWLKQELTSYVIWDGKSGIEEVDGQRVFFPHPLNDGALTLTPRTICQSTGFRKVLYEALICLSENVPTYSSSFLWKEKDPFLLSHPTASSFPCKGHLWSFEFSLLWLIYSFFFLFLDHGRFKLVFLPPHTSLSLQTGRSIFLMLPSLITEG